MRLTRDKPDFSFEKSKSKIGITITYYHSSPITILLSLILIQQKDHDLRNCQLSYPESFNLKIFLYLEDIGEIITLVEG